MRGTKAKRLRRQARAEATCGTGDRRRTREPWKPVNGVMRRDEHGTWRWSEYSFRAVLRDLKRKTQ